MDELSQFAVAEMLGVLPRQVRDLVESGELPARPAAYSSFFVERTSVEKYLEQREQRAVED